MQEKNTAQNTNSTDRRGVDCLLVKKVYDECSKRCCLEDAEFEAKFPCGCEEYHLVHIEFGKAEVEPFEDEVYFYEKDECRAKMKCVIAVEIFGVFRKGCEKRLYKFPLHIIVNGHTQKDNKVRFPIETTVYAPRTFLRQGRFTPYAESFVETGCIKMNHDNIITMSLGFFFIIKIISDVELKVPNFGFCDVPPECDEECSDVHFCETFLDECITPFPDFFPNDIDSSCH